MKEYALLLSLSQLENQGLDEHVLGKSWGEGHW